MTRWISRRLLLVATGPGVLHQVGLLLDFLAQVYLRVAFSLVAARELSATCLACEWLLPRMGPDVSGQVVAPAEVSQTDPTLERLMTRVDANVPSQLVAPGEPPVTVFRWAGVWSLVGWGPPRTGDAPRFVSGRFPDYARCDVVWLPDRVRTGRDLHHKTIADALVPGHDGRRGNLRARDGWLAERVFSPPEAQRAHIRSAGPVVTHHLEFDRRLYVVLRTGDVRVSQWRLLEVQGLHSFEGVWGGLHRSGRG